MRAGMNATILDALKQAVAEGKLLESSLENIELLTGGTQDPAKLWPRL